MRERRQQPQPATANEPPAAAFTRHFAPGDLDIDDLAEAVRMLLDECAPAHNLHLLSRADQSDSCHGGRNLNHMAVAVYMRVSTEEQRERQSIATQRDFAQRYCELHSLPVYRVFADEGISGTVALEKRPEGSQILTEARLRKFDQLLIYKLDRLGRETRLILNAVAELEKLGVRIRSMTEEFDTGTATGRLMLTLLSGFASNEREVIRERSVAGTDRVAETGAWMGGIVPYGYRKVGEKREARLVISEEPIPGIAMSEADVIREIFRLAAVEKKSCRYIAARLNELRIPPAYVRDHRLTLRGKRKQRTAGVWHPGRIRWILTNKSYMGVHEFGKRTQRKREVICRPVPAIVSEQTWNKAQKTLRSNFLFGLRSARDQYLLRGLIKCGVCGRTYVGVAANRPNGKREFYYRCNGAHSPSIHAGVGRCRGKASAVTFWNSRYGPTSRRSCAIPSRCCSSFRCGWNRTRRAPDRSESRSRGWRDCWSRKPPNVAA